MDFGGGDGWVMSQDCECTSWGGPVLGWVGLYRMSARRAPTPISRSTMYQRLTGSEYQKRIVPSTLAETSVLPSGKNFT